MTYNVFGGTFNLAQSINQSITLHRGCIAGVWSYLFKMWNSYYEIHEESLMLYCIRCMRTTEHRLICSVDFKTISSYYRHFRCSP